MDFIRGKGTRTNRCLSSEAAVGALPTVASFNIMNGEYVSFIRRKGFKRTMSMIGEITSRFKTNLVMRRFSTYGIHTWQGDENKSLPFE